MSVSDTDLIDFVSEKDGRVTLSVADHLTWDEEGAHLVQLQDKLNRYCDFINSGELADKFPKLADARPLIRVHFVHAPSSAAERFLALAADSIREEGIDFAYGLVSSDSQDDV